MSRTPSPSVVSCPDDHVQDLCQLLERITVTGGLRVYIIWYPHTHTLEQARHWTQLPGSARLSKRWSLFPKHHTQIPCISIKPSQCPTYRLMCMHKALCCLQARHQTRNTPLKLHFIQYWLHRFQSLVRLHPHVPVWNLKDSMWLQLAKKLVYSTTGKHCRPSLMIILTHIRADVAERTHFVSGNVHKGYPLFQKALEAYTVQYNEGRVRAVPIPGGPFWPSASPPSPSWSASSDDLWSQVDDVSGTISHCGF